jgi:hypothetical protein
MFHACIERFDVMGERGNILGWDGEVNKALAMKIFSFSRQWWLHHTMPRLIPTLRKINMLNYQMRYQHLILINSNNNFSNFKLRCEKLKDNFMGLIPPHGLRTGQST